MNQELVELVESVGVLKACLHTVLATVGSASSVASSRLLCRL